MSVELRKNTRYKLLRLTEEIDSLDAVREKILERIYKTLLPLKNLPEDMEDDEKYYYSRWNVETNNTESNSIYLHLNDKNCNEIPYLKVTASCEYATRRRKDENNQILPKNHRLNIEQTDVVFVYQNEEVYAVVFTVEHQPLVRIKKLIGEDFISSEDNINNLTSDFFHWLFYRYTMNKRDLGNYINLENIVGFTGIIMTDDHIVKGISDQTAELIVTKAFISNGYPIKSIKVKLYSGNGMLTFFVNENDDLYVESGSSISLSISKCKEDIAMPIFLFFIVLPELRRLYTIDEQAFIGEEKLKFNAEMGKEVIRSIASKNAIDLNSLI